MLSGLMRCAKRQQSLYAIMYVVIELWCLIPNSHTL